MKKILLVISTILFCQHAQSAAQEEPCSPPAKSVADFPTYIAEEVSTLPTLEGVTVDQVMEVFTGGAEINGRIWELRKIGNHKEFKAAIEGSPEKFTITPFADEKFIFPLFDLDKNNTFRMNLAILNHEKTDTDGDSLIHVLEFVTDLTSEEMENPFLLSIRSTYSFDEIDAAGAGSALHNAHL